MSTYRFRPMRSPLPFTSGIAPLLLLLAAAIARAQIPSEQSLLWKIEGNGLNGASYIYGTMHVQHKDVFNLADSVLPALAACQWFATEVNLDTMSRIYIERLLHLDDIASSDEGVEIEGKAFIREMFRSGSSDESQGSDDGGAYRESSASSGESRWRKFGDIISRSRAREQDGPVFLDAWLFQTAKRLGKELLGVEDVVEHLDVLDEDEEEEAEMTEEKDSASGSPQTVWKGVSFQRKMLDAYRKGDVTKIESLMREVLPPHRFHKLLTRRNRIMVESIGGYIAQAPTFIAIGAGHLGGDYGVIALLRDRGYTVTPVRATWSGRPSRVTITGDLLPWKRLDDAAGAFSVELPLDPVAAPFDTVDGDEPQIRLWMTADAGGGLLYMVYSVDVPTSYSNPYLGGLLSTLTAGWVRSLEGDSLSVTDISLAGMAGKEAVIRNDDVSYRMRVCMRGARFYILAVAGDERLVRGDDAERFFASFRTRPFVPHQWKKVALEDEGLELELSGDPLDNQEDALYLPNTTIRSVSSRDVNSGRSYSLQVIRYSDYYYTGPIDGYWKRIIADWIGPTQKGADSVISVQGFAGRDITVTDTATRSITRVRSFIVGRRLIEIWGVEGSNHDGAEAMDRFIASIRLTTTSTDGDIQVSHAERIIQDVMDDSEERRHRAWLEISRYNWTTDDLPLIYRAIDRAYPWDENLDEDPDSRKSTRELLVRTLDGVHDTTTIPFLRALFARTGDDIEVRGAIVDVLARIGTTRSVSVMIDLLKEEKRGLPGFSFYSLLDSLPRISSLLPEIVRLAEIRAYRMSIFQLIEQGFDSGYISSGLFQKTDLARICRLSIDERLHPPSYAEDTKEGISQQERWSAVALRVLGWLEKSDENVRAIKEMLPDTNSVLSLSATVALIRMAGSAPREYIDALASDSTLVVWFYTELQGLRSTLFPSFWKKQAHFSMGMLIRWISEDYGSKPTEVRYLAQRETDVQGGRGRVFLFKFRFADGEWYTGLGGPQPIDSSEVSIDGSLCFSRYRPLSTFSIDRHFKELLDQ